MGHKNRKRSSAAVDPHESTAARKGPPAPKPVASRGTRRSWVIIGLVVLCTLALFHQSRDHGFVNWDDRENVYENANLKPPLSWESAKAIFGRQGVIIGGYNPLPILTFALEKQLFGLNLQDPLDARAARVLHTTNLVLHLACVVLVYFFLRRLGLGDIAAGFAALLFGIHPMRVESVVWITERKDVLFATFYFAALLAYLRFLRPEPARWLWYAAALLLAVLALFAKIQAVALPLAMLCIDYYLKRRGWIRLFAEKAPFFLLSLLFGLLGVYFLRHEGTLEDALQLSFPQRLLVGAFSYCVYLIKFLVPYEMSPLYPYPSSLGPEFYVAPLGILAVLAVLVWAYRTDRRAVVFGVGFFTVNVMFVLQVLGAGQGFLADRFTYVAYVGLFLLVGAAFDHLAAGKSRPWLLFAGGAYAALMAFMTWNQVQIWKSGETLWTHVLKSYSKAVTPWQNRAHYYRDFAKDSARALADYDQALKLKEGHGLFNSRGKLMLEAKQYDRAIADYTRAIQLSGTNAEYFANRGAAYGLSGQTNLALADLNRCLELDPRHANGLLNRSLALFLRGDLEGAINDYSAYLQVRPMRAEIWYERGVCRQSLGRHPEALSDFSRALELEPAGKNTPLYYLKRAQSHLALGNTEPARADARQASLKGAQLPPNLKQLVP